MLPLKSWNIAIQSLANATNPNGYDVSADAPTSLLGIQEYYRENSRICVWDGASDKTIFGDAGINHAARAWHDSAHYRLSAGLDALGERIVFSQQVVDLDRLYHGHHEMEQWLELLAIDVLGQLSYHKQFGAFPSDQVAFTQDCLAGHLYRVHDAKKVIAEETLALSIYRDARHLDAA